MKRNANCTESTKLAPKPVHPTAIRNHGLLGIPFLRQHMMIDERWTPSSLTEEFHGVADLLAKRLIFKRLEAKANWKRNISLNRNLRQQCRDGRIKLQMSLGGNNEKHIRNFLLNHTDMQRLYQKMPIQLVLDNINQRTFVMRKERDRLRFRLDQLKSIYSQKLLTKSVLENRITYQNEFALEEEAKMREFRKKIENSNVRLKAIKTINGTYKKMIQILRHDSIFYEPILRSLTRDITDQTQFIKHVLYLGMPAIAKFKELNEEYRQMEERAHKDMQSKLSYVTNLRRDSMNMRFGSMSYARLRPPDRKMNFNRYVRETPSMNELKYQLERISNIIKEIKSASLCSQVTEIFPRIKQQVEGNKKLQKKIMNDILTHTNLETRMRRADVLEGVLVNNLAEDEIKRLEQIRSLQDQLADEHEFELNNVKYMKERAKYYVLLRFSLWNLNDIMHGVGRNARVRHVVYPNSYLALPLLKFEMQTMRAFPPMIFENNIDKLLTMVTNKVNLLLNNYNTHMSNRQIAEYNEQYHTAYIDTVMEDELVEEEGPHPVEEDDDDQFDSKLAHQVPNRKAIKALSAKLVEEMSKKDD